MPVNELQLQLYGDELGMYRAEVNYPHVKINKQIAVDSPNYLFLYLQISPEAKPGRIPIQLKRDNETIEMEYELKKRPDNSNRHQGFDASDVIYLMMPDRFANGNPENDSIEGMLESADRSNPQRRQGGDIQGVINHLDYISSLGMTAIWFTPMFENDMNTEYGAYHGYAATNLYKVDRRFDSNELYKTLVDSVHARGMKVIMDMIHNHIGDNHWWMKDLPSNDWVYEFEKYGQTNFRGTAASDPYASEYDRNKLERGWFVPEMPDLNQNNELLADYLIQNTIWWIEYSGINGIRMDTYVYPDKDYMARWAQKVLAAYPDFNIVGEAWVEDVVHASFWQDSPGGFDDGYDSQLPSITDFPLSFAIRNALKEDFSWNTGLSMLYTVVSQDRLYSNPMKNVVFLDNHDMSRVFEHFGKDEKLFKMAYAYLMTTRGIPQVYYGTELMMGHENSGGDDEVWRQTMPGGWPDDDRSVFSKQGRTKKENEILSYISKLTNWRKTAPAIHKGKMIHFIPQNDIYVFFRIHPEQTVMIVMNHNNQEKTLRPNVFKEVLENFTTGTHILNNSVIDVTTDFKVPAKETSIWELE